MREYHKINSVYKRDHKTGRFIFGEYSDSTFEFLAGNQWGFTEKVDGTNVRVKWDAEAISYGGKTDNAQFHTGLFAALGSIFNDKAKVFSAVFGQGPACLYGEGYGAKIQTGHTYKPDGQDFVLFDVRVGHWWLEREDVEDVAAKFGLRVVPIIGRGTLAEMMSKAEIGFDSAWGQFKAEGIVARPLVGLLKRSGDRIITKVKYKDFK